MKTSALKFIWIFSLIVLSGSTAAQSSYTLRYKFEPGETYRFSNSVITNVVQQAMGQEVRIDVTADVIQKIVAEDKIDENMVLITTLDSVNVRTKMPGRDTTMIPDFGDIRTRIVLSPNGEIVDRKFVDTVNQSAEQFQQLSNQSFRFFDLPIEEVKTGSTWNAEATDTVNIMGGDMISISQTDYTLTGEEVKEGYKCVKIDFTSTSSNEGKTSMMGMDLFIEGTGKTTGTLYFAPEEGIMVVVNAQADTDLTMATTGEQKMIIPITQSSKITQTYLK